MKVPRAIFSEEMRVAIFVIGSILLTICVFVSLANTGVPLTARTPVPLGYFVVVATAFLATALYRENRAAVIRR